MRDRRTTVNSHYLEHAVSRISRYLELFPSPFSIYGLLPYKMSRYLELISWSQGRIAVAISNFSENIAQRNQSIKIFSCVFEHVFLIECYFN